MADLTIRLTVGDGPERAVARDRIWRDLPEGTVPAVLDAVDAVSSALDGLTRMSGDSKSWPPKGLETK